MWGERASKSELPRPSSKGLTGLVFSSLPQDVPIFRIAVSSCEGYGQDNFRWPEKEKSGENGHGKSRTENNRGQITIITAGNQVNSSREWDL
jgi:hypothetical protein